MTTIEYLDLRRSTMVTKLVSSNKISKEEGNRLQSMIDSKDKDSYNLALDILTELDLSYEKPRL